MKFALDKFGPRELDALINAAEKQKQRIAKRRPLAVVRAELTVLSLELGYSIQELFGDHHSVATDASVRKPAKRRSVKAPIKYRDPENRKNTWSGRGSQPRWLREKVRRGLSAADFLVDGLAKPTANTKSIGKRTVFKQG